MDFTGLGLRLFDPDDRGGNATLVLVANHGAFTATAGDSGVVVTSGSGTGTLTLTGPTIALDNLLRGGTTGTLAYTTSFVGTITFTLTVTDQDGLRTIRTFNGQSAAFSAPVVTAPASALAADKDVAFNIHGASKFGVTDADDTTLPAVMELVATAGTITVAVGNTGCTVTSGNTTADVLIAGTITQLNNLLTGTGSGTIQFTSPSTGNKTFTVTVTDSDGLSGNNHQTVGVFAKPVVSIPGLVFLAVTTGTPYHLEGIGFSLADTDANGTQTLVLHTTTGTIDVTVGTSGVTIASGDTTATVTLTGTLAQLNNLLQHTGTGTIVFNDGGNATGTLTLTDTDDTARVGTNSIPITVSSTATWTGYAAATPQPTAVTISGFVGSINLFNMPAAWWSAVTDDGRDIRVTLDDGTTLLPRDLVIFNKVAKIGFLHVRYTSSTTSPRVRVWVGAALSPAPSVSSTYGQHNVYDTFIKGVWSGTGADRTGNANDLTATAGVGAVASDFNDGSLAATYDGVSGANTCAVAIPSDEPYILITAIRPTNIAAGTVASLDRDTFRNVLGIASSVFSADTQSISGSTVTHNYATAVGVLTSGIWQSIAAGFLSDSRRVAFRDAGAQGTNTKSLTIPSHATTLRLGTLLSPGNTNSAFYKGSIGLTFFMNALDESLIGPWCKALSQMINNNAVFWGGGWTFVTQSTTGL